jgi:hypothetical protein
MVHLLRSKEVRCYIICFKWFVMTTTQGIEWEDVIKKEARGINDDDLGEVQISARHIF